MPLSPALQGKFLSQDRSSLLGELGIAPVQVRTWADAARPKAERKNNPSRAATLSEPKKRNPKRVATGAAKTWLEWEVYGKDKEPGPTDYQPPGKWEISGGRFNAARSKSDIEWACYRAKQVPGPGQYPETVTNRKCLPGVGV